MAKGSFSTNGSGSIVTLNGVAVSPAASVVTKFSVGDRVVRKTNGFCIEAGCIGTVIANSEDLYVTWDGDKYPYVYSKHEIKLAVEEIVAQDSFTFCNHKFYVYNKVATCNLCNKESIDVYSFAPASTEACRHGCTVGVSNQHHREFVSSYGDLASGDYYGCVKCNAIYWIMP